MARIAADDEGADAEAGAASREADAEASTPPAAVPAAPPARNAHERALYVETAIQQAIRRGEFDDLPGAGKPLEGLGDHHDPDWWIRRKIQSEQLTGLGPPALLLRGEHAEFAARVDALTPESDVREYVDDFNRRVIDARRQLQGGPPSSRRRVMSRPRSPPGASGAARALRRRGRGLRPGRGLRRWAGPAMPPAPGNDGASGRFEAPEATSCAIESRAPAPQRRALTPARRATARAGRRWRGCRSRASRAPRCGRCAVPRSSRRLRRPSG